MKRFIEHQDFGIGEILSSDERFITIRFFGNGSTKKFLCDSPTLREIERKDIRLLYSLKNRTNQVSVGECDGCGEKKLRMKWSVHHARIFVDLCSICEDKSLKSDFFKVDVLNSGRIAEGSFGSGKRRLILQSIWCESGAHGEPFPVPRIPRQPTAPRIRGQRALRLGGPVLPAAAKGVRILVGDRGLPTGPDRGPDGGARGGAPAGDPVDPRALRLHPWKRTTAGAWVTCLKEGGFAFFSGK
jgi:hypothetical protein